VEGVCDVISVSNFVMIA